MVPKTEHSTLPTGTVTFLFTDIEGSTALWDQDPAAMRSALADHYRPLRRARRSHRGQIGKTRGDGVMAVFPAASDALGASLVAQRHFQRASAEAKHSEDTTERCCLRVRMGLHTGEATMRDGDYFGSALNVAARIMSVAQGDQVLLSAVTGELMRGHLPPGVSLKTMGEHRLKGVSRPVHLLQLVAQELRGDFAPLSAAAARDDDTRLPKPLT